MIQYIKEHQATVSLLLAQDVATFKDSVPYRWLQNMIGEKQTDAIGVLDKIAAHRFGIFVQDINTVIDKQDIKQAAMMALQEKQINFEQWFIVTQTDDPKRAAQLLSYLQRRADKRLRAQALQDKKIEMDMQNQQHANKMAELNFDRQTKITVANIERDGFIGAAQINKDGRLNTQELKNAGALEHTAAKTEGTIQTKKEEANIEQQKPLPNPATPIPASPQPTAALTAG